MFSVKTMSGEDTYTQGLSETMHISVEFDVIILMLLHNYKEYTLNALVRGSQQGR